MIEKLFALALTLGTLNNAKPKLENEFDIENGTPEILRVISDDAKNIILNSYYYPLSNTELTNTGITQYECQISIRYWLTGGPNPTKFIRNKIYFIADGYPEKYPGIIGNETTDYILNPYGSWNGDGEYYHFIMEQLGMDDPSEEEYPFFVSSISDYESGFGNYGILIPKDTYYENAQRADIKIGDLSIDYYSEFERNENNPKGINTDLLEPAFIKYENYAPFRNVKQNTNYLKNEHGSYTPINDNLVDSTADDNMYYYDALFDNTYFINRAKGIGNYAVNAMYLQYPSGPDYKYTSLTMYNINPSKIESTYQQTLNRYYNESGGYKYINTSNATEKINRITNSTPDNNGNYWTFDYASEFIILNPKKIYNGIDQMQVLESHMITGVKITADTIGITIDAGMVDVFNLLASAFSGFGTFFAIAILPGITLGTLFLMPFITTLIIWLIHMFKRH